MGQVELNPIVKLVEDMPIKKDDSLITYAKAKILAFTNTTYVITPVPTIVLVTTHTTDYATKQAKTKQRTVGLADDRDVAKRLVVIDLHCWAALVQYLADQDPVNAITIIKSFGYKTKNMPSNYKKDFEIRHGKTSGSATIISKSAGRNTYYARQMSEDGHTWTDLEGTMFCKLDIKGLIPGKTYYFRYCFTNNKGKSDWSQMEVLIAL